jgi:phospholipid/cholesterol/gamma-HCH transport system ATP-binding protein
MLKETGNNSKNDQPQIEIEHLEKAFGSNVVLKDLNFTLKKGENVVVFGRSGSGKSVLIKCIIGLMHADAGTLKVFGKSIPDLSQHDLDRVREKIGFLFQSNALYDSMTVRENLEFPLRRHIKEKTREEIDKLVIEVLTNVGLEHTVDMMPSELSGGMRKRIGLARCLIVKPEIILYDEPTTGLDPITAKEISNLMLDMQKKYNASSVIISHDKNCSKLTSNRMLILIDGKIHAEGTYEELEKSEDEKVKAFFE